MRILVQTQVNLNILVIEAASLKEVHNQPRILLQHERIVCARHVTFFEAQQSLLSHLFAHLSGLNFKAHDEPWVKTHDMIHTVEDDFFVFGHWRHFLLKLLVESFMFYSRR